LYFWNVDRSALGDEIYTVILGLKCLIFKDLREGMGACGLVDVDR